MPQRRYKMGLRLKIISGFSILAAMLFVAGLIMIFQLNKIGNSIENLFTDYYTSIEAANLMGEAIDQHATGVLFVINKDTLKGTTMMKQSEELFRKSYEQALAHVTVKGEDTLLASIHHVYTIYLNQIKQQSGKSTEVTLDQYVNFAHNTIGELRSRIKEFAYMNQNAMLDTGKLLQMQTHQTIMPGIIALIGSVVFVLLFNYMVNHFIASPIVRITKAVEVYSRSKKPYKVAIDTKDELSRLSTAISKLLQSLPSR